MTKTTSQSIASKLITRSEIDENVLQIQKKLHIIRKTTGFKLPTLSSKVLNVRNGKYICEGYL